MSFKILLLPPDIDPSWADKIRQAVPGAVVQVYGDPQEALSDIEDTDAAYGTVPPARAWAATGSTTRWSRARSS